jgi:hypothetical protein
MNGKRRILILCLAVATCGVVLPAAASGHQLATLSGGVMTITGDQEHNGEPKHNDLVTVEYDADRNELIFGQDVFGPHPSQCSPDQTHPQRIIHCPAGLISRVRVDSGIGSDDVSASTPADVPVDAILGTGKDSFQGGREVDTVNGGLDGDKIFGGAGGDVLKGAGASDKLYGQGGADSLFGGGGADQLFGGGGNDNCDPGPVAGKQQSC